VAPEGNLGRLLSKKLSTREMNASYALSTPTNELGAPLCSTYEISTRYTCD